jgi:hypothetical protein
MLSKCVTKSPNSYQKITDNCKYFPNIVTTEMSEILSKFNFFHGMPHLTIFCVHMVKFWKRMNLDGSLSPQGDRLVNPFLHKYAFFTRVRLV